MKYRYLQTKSNGDKMDTTTKSHAVQIAKAELSRLLVDTEYSAGNIIIPIRHIRQLIVRDTDLVDRLHRSVHGKIKKELQSVIEEAANELGYKRQPVMITSNYPIAGEIVPERDSYYWVKQAA